VIDTFHVYGVEVAGKELMAQSVFLAFLESFFQYLIPAVGLQDGDIVIFFVFTDLFGDLHALGKDLQQFIIEVIDLLAQFFQCRVQCFGFDVFFSPDNG